MTYVKLYNVHIQIFIQSHHFFKLVIINFFLPVEPRVGISWIGKGVVAAEVKACFCILNIINKLKII